MAFLLTAFSLLDIALQVCLSNMKYMIGWFINKMCTCYVCTGLFHSFVLINRLWFSHSGDWQVIFCKLVILL